MEAALPASSDATGPAVAEWTLVEHAVVIVEGMVVGVEKSTPAVPVATGPAVAEKVQPL